MPAAHAMSRKTKGSPKAETRQVGPPARLLGRIATVAIAAALGHSTGDGLRAHRDPGGSGHHAEALHGPARLFRRDVQYAALRRDHSRRRLRAGQPVALGPALHGARAALPSAAARAGEARERA